MFLTAEQASEMSKEECLAHIKKLSRKYKLERPLSECFTEIWPILDEITNTLLYCEDRIDQIETAERLKYANDARWGRLGDTQ